MSGTSIRLTVGHDGPRFVKAWEMLIETVVAPVHLTTRNLRASNTRFRTDNRQLTEQLKESKREYKKDSIALARATKELANLKEKENVMKEHKRKYVGLEAEINKLQTWLAGAHSARDRLQQQLTVAQARINDLLNQSNDDHILLKSAREEATEAGSRCTETDEKNIKLHRQIDTLKDERNRLLANLKNMTNDMSVLSDKLARYQSAESRTRDEGKTRDEGRARSKGLASKKHRNTTRGREETTLGKREETGNGRGVVSEDSVVPVFKRDLFVAVTDHVTKMIKHYRDENPDIVEACTAYINTENILVPDAIQKLDHIYSLVPDTEKTDIFMRKQLLKSMEVLRMAQTS